MSENFANNPRTTLSTDMSSSITSISVSSAGGFPSVGNYRIMINTEILLVTGGQGTTTWTVSRAQESTTAQSNNAGSLVLGILTASAVTQWRSDACQSDVTANLPASTNAGIQYFPTDGNYAYRDNGTAFFGWGPLYPLTPPINSNFSWIAGPGTSGTVDTSHGGVFLYDGATAAEGVNLLYVRGYAAPATPYTITLGYLPLFPFIDQKQSNVGMCLSDGTKFVSFATVVNRGGASWCFGYGVFRWSDSTTFAGPASENDNAVPQQGPLFWQQLVDDGTNRNWSLSIDGYNWSLFYQETRTAFMTATKIGFYVDAQQATASSNHITGINVLHWTVH